MAGLGGGAGSYERGTPVAQTGGFTVRVGGPKQGGEEEED